MSHDSVPPAQQPPPANRSRNFTCLNVALSLIALAYIICNQLFVLRDEPSRVMEPKMDIEKLSTGINAFKLEFGATPPSSITFSESANWTSKRHPDLPRSRSELRKIFPDFTFGPTDLNGDGDTDDLIHLSGAECLVFFLGGMRDLESGVLDSFSTNPVEPFTHGGDRYSTFYDFGGSGFDRQEKKWTGRLVDLDGDMMPELLDTIPGQLKPYLYFSTYGGKGYRTVERPPQHPGIADRHMWHHSENFDPRRPLDGMPYPYYRSFDRFSSTRSKAHNMKSFQLISPGFDFEYGIGGLFDPEDPSSLNTADRDNIVNFHGGVLDE